MNLKGWEFMWNPHHGFITTCPTNIGTGLRAGVHIKLKHLPKVGHNSRRTLLTINLGMPNLRKNAFSTDFDHLFQPTDKKIIYGRIYGLFVTRVGYYPPPRPHCTAVFYGKNSDLWTSLICSYSVRLLATTPPPPPT